MVRADGPALGTRLAAAAGAVTAAAMVATPLLPTGGRARRVLAAVTMGAMATTTTARAWRRWGGPRAAGAAAAVTASTLAIERVGSTRGVPFGRYEYTGALRPAIGAVPLVVPAAWWAMALPAREAAHAALGTRSTVRRRVVAGAVALTAWDVFLDPQMVREGYWRWHRRGAYRGIPLTNFVGWLVTAAAVMAMLELVLPVRDEEPDAALVAEYAGMATMETVGFAAFFRDRVVAAAGGASMLPVAASAVVGVLRRRAGAPRGQR
jgi:putative membrane protein